MTAARDDPAGAEAVVRKPPRKEPAGSEARLLPARYGGFDWSDAIRTLGASGGETKSGLPGAEMKDR